MSASSLRLPPAAPAYDIGTQIFRLRPPTEASFSQGPSRPEKTTCDGRRSSKAEDQLLLTLSFAEYFLRISNLGEQMGEVVQFIPKRDLDRARLIQEARAIYERIFPTEGPASLQRDPTNP
jgi:hypothetical protein